MSMLTDTLQEVNVLRYQLEQEEGRIRTFLSSNQKQMQLVRTAIQGSRNSHDTRMLSALQQAEDSLKKAQTAIQQALTALMRVSSI